MTRRGFKPVKPEQLPMAAVEIPIVAAWKLIPYSALLFARNSPTSFVLFLLPSLLLQLGVSLVADFTVFDNLTLLGLTLEIIAGTLIMANVGASIYCQVRVAHGEQPGILESYRKSLRYILRLIGAVALLAFVTPLALLLGIVPGLIFIRRYALTLFYLLDEDLGIREAMQRSAADSKPKRLHVWSMLFILACIAAAGFGIQMLHPVYGTFAATLLGGLMAYIPSLRYRELGLNLSIASIKH